jgi:type II secretory pathway pseudopilin PulG
MSGKPVPRRRLKGSRRALAFTLVELLVVIGIIAILIGILLPALGRARAVANRTACLSEMRQMGMTLEMFTQEHKGYLPKAWFNSGPTPSANSAADCDPSVPGTVLKEDWGFRKDMWGWDYLLIRYMKGNKQVFRCRSDDSGMTRGVGTTASSANLPDAHDADDIPASYRMNISNQSDPYRAVKLTQLPNAAQAILLVEGLPSPFHHIATWETGTTGNDGKVGKWNRINIAYKRHPKEMNNYIFADGHGEYLAWLDTWKPIGPKPAHGQGLFGASTGLQGITMWRARYVQGAIDPGKVSDNGVRMDQFYPPPLNPPD